MSSKLILSLNAKSAALSLVGGKGLNLSRLAQAGFPVPGGFLITTEAYTAYLLANSLGEKVVAMAEATDSHNLDALEATASAIRADFTTKALPHTLREFISEAYTALGSPPVAVRSSATAEDLPDLSFAGQQETYLNVTGLTSLLEAVVACWGSLWTARAIGYRARNGIGQRDLTLAIVVQRMVNSIASGVLFTANPLSGLRTETVIDATLGLGEALVSGLVEPDQYRVDPAQRRILHKQLGAKALSILPKAEGGTLVQSSAASTQQALPDAAILDLAVLGQRVANLYGTPQDIEWAWAGEQLYLLQTRAITSLYPLPPIPPEKPMAVLLSFGAVQGMLDPITPLGRDILCSVAAAVNQRLGIRVTLETQYTLLTAGERLFINFTGIAHNRMGRKILTVALDSIEPGGAQSLKGIWNEPAFGAPGSPRPRSLWRLARFFVPIFARVIRNWARPAIARERIYHGERAALDGLAARSAAAHTLTGQLELIRDIEATITTGVQSLLLPGIVSGIASLQLLRIASGRIASGRILNPPPVSALEVVRGLPHNVTTEMDMALWACAQAIRGSAEDAALFAGTDAGSLAADWHAGHMPPTSQQAINGFMERYGMRGLAEIDIGRPRWREDATPVIHTLQSYLQITAPEQAPDAVFARGAKTAEAALNSLVAAARNTRYGALKARLVRFLGTRVRALTGLRENPKFFAIRMMGILRAALLKIGAELVTQGTLTQADDLFYLHVPELEALARGESRDWQALVAERRNVYQREKRRQQSPRLLLGDGRAFYAGLGQETGDDELHGSPVSPGVAENAARVVFDPRNARLEAGEILVCPGTDPSWTPLFLTAGGLVMEVGGLMTHGAVVAREYGIPAVVGVHEATQRIKTGQHIRIDGALGRIIIVEGKK